MNTFQNRNTYQLSATALFYSLLLSTLIGIILTALVAIWLFHKTEQTKDFELWDQLQLLDAGFKWVSQQKKDYLLESIQLFEEQEDSLIVSKHPWGIFELVGCQIGSYRHGKLNRIGLIGQKTNINPTMVLGDSRKPLALSGHSQIIGNAVVPLGGITTATVNNKPFSNNRAVIGKIINGGGEMPKLELEWLNKIKRPINAIKKSIETTPDSLELSFMERPYFFQDSVLELQQQHWTGPFFLEADSLIRIKKGCRLDGAILKAPKIEIEAGFRGQIQAVAELDLSIGENVHLEYPSAVIIFPNEQLSIRQSARVHIDKNSLIEGSVLGFKPQNNDEIPNLSLENAIITGRILWDGSVEASGQVNGNFFARNFFYRGDGTRFYFNYMVDFVINGSKRSKHWVESMILQGKEKAVGKWLN